MEQYARRQSLLRDSQGSACATLLMERCQGRCLIQLHPLSAMPAGSKACLIKKEALFSLGAFSSDGSLSAELPGAEYTAAPCVCVYQGPKLLYAEGGPDDFHALRLLFFRHRSPAPTKPPEKPAEKETPLSALPQISALPEPPEKTALPLFSLPLPSHWHVEFSDWKYGFLRVSEALSSHRVHCGLFAPYSFQPPPGLPGFKWENGVWWETEKLT